MNLINDRKLSDGAGDDDLLRRLSPYIEGEPRPASQRSSPRQTNPMASMPADSSGHAPALAPEPKTYRRGLGLVRLRPSGDEPDEAKAERSSLLADALQAIVSFIRTLCAKWRNC